MENLTALISKVYEVPKNEITIHKEFLTSDLKFIVKVSFFMECFFVEFDMKTKRFIDANEAMMNRYVATH